MSEKSQIAKPNTQPEIEIKKERLIQSEFTNSGVRKYTSAILQYSRELFATALLIADNEKAEGYNREISERTISSAINQMEDNKIRLRNPQLLVVTQIFEYVFTLVAGAGASNLDSKIGVLAFGFGLSIAIVLFIFRITYIKSRRTYS